MLELGKIFQPILSNAYVGFVIVSISFIGWSVFPGHTDYDTISMFEQAKTGVFYDWHSPAVTAIWSLLGGKVWIIGATMLLTMGGIAYYIYSFFLLAGLPRNQACLFTFLTCYTPPVLGILGCVCKDSWVALFFISTLYYTICYHVKKQAVWVVVHFERQKRN